LLEIRIVMTSLDHHLGGIRVKRERSGFTNGWKNWVPRLRHRAHGRSQVLLLPGLFRSPPGPRGCWPAAHRHCCAPRVNYGTISPGSPWETTEALTPGWSPCSRLRRICFDESTMI
jgi:hypothetical protein